MSAPFTPGPWKPVCGLDDDNTRWSVVAAASNHEWHIATIENGQPGDSLETEAATASLIAAAPDLYEAAKHAAMEWRLHGQLTDSCRVLEAAIEEAEGRR